MVQFGNSDFLGFVVSNVPASDVILEITLIGDAQLSISKCEVFVGVPDFQTLIAMQMGPVRHIPLPGSFANGSSIRVSLDFNKDPDMNFLIEYRAFSQGNAIPKAIATMHVQ